MEEKHEKYSVETEIEQGLEVIEIQLESDANERSMPVIYDKIDELLALEPARRKQIRELVEGVNIDSKVKKDILDYLEDLEEN